MDALRSVRESSDYIELEQMQFQAALMHAYCCYSYFICEENLFRQVK